MKKSKASGKGPDVTARVEGLERAVEAADGRLDDKLVSEARQVVDRAGQRLRLSGDHTIVALAGATGSGKSSLFNQLCELELAAIGVKRPTTSWALACTWGANGAGELLDWLGVPPRHRSSKSSVLDLSEADQELNGLVLLDLPDHDSTEVSHHLEVDRLVHNADLVVWVLDPQKYADAVLHERYLKKLVDHSDVMLFVLNHMDEVPAEQHDAVLDDVRRVLAEDGLSDVTVLSTAAVRGEGVATLRKELVRRVQAKETFRSRLIADIQSVSDRMSSATGDANPPDAARQSKDAVVEAFAQAAGVPVVVDAVKQSTRMRARRATGWPLSKWLGRFRTDPAKRLRLDLGPGAKTLRAAARDSLPEATAVQRERVDSTVRGVVDDATASLPHRWASAVRRSSSARLPEVGDALDKAVGETDLGVARRPLWWGLVKLLQWLVFLGTLAGVGWIGTLLTMAYLRRPEPETPEVYGVSLPILLAAGGVLVGVAMALVSRMLAAISARRKARIARRRLYAAIEEVVQRYVIEPIENEIDQYRICRDGLAAARKS